MRTYRLGSTHMIHTPGVLGYIRRINKDGDFALADSLLRAAFGEDFPAAVKEKILKGDYNVDDDVAIVEVEGAD